MQNPLNNAAGQMPLPSDPRELAAAVRASEVVWRAFPYFSFRYGERGRRFGYSDSAYFLTLLGYDQQAIDRQIVWTAGVLASRGMPSLLVELQLRVLHRITARTLQDSSRSEPLLRAADMLRDRRRACLSDDDMTDLGRAFAARAGYPEHPRCVGMGRLLGCAVADEWNGVKNAVSSMESWLTDPALFPRSWIAAVNDGIRRGRQLSAWKP